MKSKEELVAAYGREFEAAVEQTANNDKVKAIGPFGPTIAATQVATMNIMAKLLERIQELEAKVDALQKK